MKVSIGTKIKDGPWGGGNLFAINLKNYLESRGHDVYFDLKQDDLDIILITEPRKTSESSAFTHIDVFNYLKHINSNSLVIHRINECDERKQTDYVNDYLISANQIADGTIFVSSWLKDLYISHGLSNNNLNVIMAGANKDIFNSVNNVPWNGVSKMKIVTHHWGANWNKGFDTYSQLDSLLTHDDYKEKFEFTYIGNLPDNFEFKNSKHILPMSGLDLATEIKKHDVYLTGSLNEPSGNHHIEAAQCGLPLLFINSGGIPEYCINYGVEFNPENFLEKLNEMYDNYFYYLKKIKSYPYNSFIMCEEYENLFTSMLDSKSSYKDKRIIPQNLKLYNKYFFALKRLF